MTTNWTLLFWVLCLFLIELFTLFPPQHTQIHSFIQELFLSAHLCYTLIQETRQWTKQNKTVNSLFSWSFYSGWDEVDNKLWQFRKEKSSVETQSRREDECMCQWTATILNSVASPPSHISLRRWYLKEVKRTITWVSGRKSAPNRGHKERPRVKVYICFTKKDSQNSAKDYIYGCSLWPRKNTD